MPRFDDDADAFGADLLHQRFSDLPGQVLLHLQAAGENIHHPRDLGKADNLSIGQIPDVTLAEKRQQMVLAQGIQFDILTMIISSLSDGEKGVVDDLADVLVVAAGQIFKSQGGATGRFL